jgi:hypothetical protein
MFKNYFLTSINMADELGLEQLLGALQGAGSAGQDYAEEARNALRRHTANSLELAYSAAVDELDGQLEFSASGHRVANLFHTFNDFGYNFGELISLGLNYAKQQLDANIDKLKQAAAEGGLEGLADAAGVSVKVTGRLKQAASSAGSIGLPTGLPKQEDIKIAKLLDTYIREPLGVLVDYFNYQEKHVQALTAYCAEHGKTPDSVLSSPAEAAEVIKQAYGSLDAYEQLQTKVITGLANAASDVEKLSGIPIGMMISSFGKLSLASANWSELELPDELAETVPQLVSKLPSRVGNEIQGAITDWAKFGKAFVKGYAQTVLKNLQAYRSGGSPTSEYL